MKDMSDPDEIMVTKLKRYHLNICIALNCFISLFVFFSAFLSEKETNIGPWWVALVYGWTGLVIATKLSGSLDQKKK
jgi:hypothetical protein